MRKRFTRAVAILVAALSLGVVGIIGGPASPASASPCNIPNWTNPSTGHGSQWQGPIWNPKTPINNATVSWHAREACWRLGIEGTAGQYRFRVWVQDTVDICTSGVQSNCSDIDGNAFVQMSTPCAGCTNPYNNIVWDWDSANWAYNESNGQSVWISPWYNEVANGPATAFKFRFVGTSRTKPITGIWFNYTHTMLPISINY